MDALQKSNVVIAKVLHLTMEHGLSHWALQFSDLGLDQSFETHFFPCLEWLESEGLIRVGSTSRTMGGLANGQVNNVALTARGMLVLGAQFEVAGKRETVSSMVEKTSAGGPDGFRIGEVIGGIIGGFTKSIGS